MAHKRQAEGYLGNLDRRIDWAQKQIAKSSLSASEGLVLIWICYRAIGVGGCYESQVNMGKSLSLSVRTVKPALDRLRDRFGVIVPEGELTAGRAARYHPLCNVPEIPNLRSLRGGSPPPTYAETADKLEEQEVRGKEAHRSEPNLDVQSNPPPGPLINPPNVYSTHSPVAENVSAVVTVGEDWQEAAALVVEEPEPEYRNGTGAEGNSFGHSKGPEPEKSPPPPTTAR